MISQLGVESALKNTNTSRLKITGETRSDLLRNIECNKLPFCQYHEFGEEFDFATLSPYQVHQEMRKENAGMRQGKNVHLRGQDCKSNGYRGTRGCTISGLVAAHQFTA